MIFDGDTDLWAYRYMQGWKEKKGIEFDFYDAEDIRPLIGQSPDETVQAALQERFAEAKQAIVLVSETAKSMFKFVRWQIEIAQKKQLPIVVVNLNSCRYVDLVRCPAVLRDWPAVHVAFRGKIVKHALDSFPEEYQKILRGGAKSGPRHYTDEIYKSLDL